MARVVQRAAHPGNVAAPGGGLDMHRQHALDPVVPVGPQRLGQTGQFDGLAAVTGQHLDLDPQTLRRRAPAPAELPGIQDEDLVAA